MSVDVLIVGAGPTGLLLAAQLARYGIKPRIIDKNPQPSQTSKAISVFARTLEIFDKLGIATEAIQRGRKLHGINLYGDRQQIAHVSFDRIDSFFPFVLCLPQADTEDMLGRLAQSLGVKIERVVTFTTLEQDADGVTATLCHPDGREERCHAAWLIGCDGARGNVRQEAGLVDAGVDLQSRFALVDARADWNLSPQEVHIFFSSDGELGVFPLPQENYWRLFVELTADELKSPEDLDLGLFQQLVNERFRLEANLTNPLWMSDFRIRQRMVNKCRIGRVFVAGDALASHSPVGGQGMNTGLQDVYNLAWKLALVIQNKASTDLLDSYEAEREPVSKALLVGTEWATRVVTLRNPFLKQMRRYLASFTISFDRVQQTLANTASELNVNYRDSPIVQEDRSFPQTTNRQAKRPNWQNWQKFRSGPKAGDLAPDIMVQSKNGSQRLLSVLSDLKHNLLLFSGKVTSQTNYLNLRQIVREIETKFRDRIATHIVLPIAQIPAELEGCSEILLDPQAECSDRYGARGECFYLIRPDSYIGYRYPGADVNQLEAYLQKIDLLANLKKEIQIVR